MVTLDKANIVLAIGAMITPDPSSSSEVALLPSVIIGDIIFHGFYLFQFKLLFRSEVCTGVVVGLFILVQ